MSLCKSCGVEVEEDARWCPLCRNALYPEPEGAHSEPTRLAPVAQKANGGMRRWLLEVLSALAAAAAIVVFVVDFGFGQALTWARYPLAAIAFLWVTAVVMILGSARMWVSLSAEIGAVGLFLFVLDAFTPGAAWFLPLAFPLTLLAGTMLSLTLLLVRRLDLSPFTIVAWAMLAAALFVVGLELLVNRYRTDRWFVSWSVATLACALPLVLLLLYLRKRFKPMQAEIRKLLHL